VDLSEFTYSLPEDLIAQRPAERRDEARLLVVRRGSGRLEHRLFRDLPELIGSTDLLVMNNTRVFPARLIGRKPSGGRIEVLLLRQLDVGLWESLVRPARRCPAGTRLLFAGEALEAEVAEGTDPWKRRLRFRWRGDFWRHIESVGRVPLPPYIRRPGDQPEDLDRNRYQTVFASRTGSVAAPTAGLHFTRELLERLPDRCEITLHVGYGTFRPVHSRRVEDHRMEAEFYSVGETAAEVIQNGIESGKRIVAVGTTTTRVLEYLIHQRGRISPEEGWTDLFIYPGFAFKAVGGLITNFHLPGSTLLMLVSAFGGMDLIRHAYRVAVESRYRFYSYGDAMLIV
jgi:S-adenosylmethionine:tRNA ribosyltransferase-isomerase